MKIITKDFYARNTVIVARELLGKIIVRNYNDQLLMGIITETEAYQSDDPACHGFNGKTIRNAALFGPVGHAYVYISYGIHYCLNFVSRDEKTDGGGVLIRAFRPLEGLDTMKTLRKKTDHNRLTIGPGNVAQALSISREHNGIPLITKELLYVIDAEKVHDDAIIATPRIGISKGTDKLWRFFYKI